MPLAFDSQLSANIVPLKLRVTSEHQPWPSSLGCSSQMDFRVFYETWENYRNFFSRTERWCDYMNLLVDHQAGFGIHAASLRLWALSCLMRMSWPTQLLPQSELCGFSLMCILGGLTRIPFSLKSVSTFTAFVWLFSYMGLLVFNQILHWNLCCNLNVYDFSAVWILMGFISFVFQAKFPLPHTSLNKYSFLSLWECAPLWNKRGFAVNFLTGIFMQVILLVAHVEYLEHGWLHNNSGSS